MPTIALAENHAVVRQGLRALLETEPGFIVVGEASDGREALDLVARAKPNILIADLMMPRLNGLEVTRLIKLRQPDTRVIILSMYSDESYVRQALRNGAAGYVLKDCEVSEVVKAVREVAAGRHYLCDRLSKVADRLATERAQGGPLDPYETLTTREREVLQLVAEGLSSTAIGTRLKISPRTAESHRANLIRKLALRTQSDLIRFALKRGIIPLDNS